MLEPAIERRINELKQIVTSPTLPEPRGDKWMYRQCPHCKNGDTKILTDPLDTAGVPAGMCKRHCHYCSTTYVCPKRRGWTEWFEAGEELDHLTKQVTHA